MSEEVDHDILYPTKDEILSIHADIIEEDEDAEGGVINGGQVEYAIDCIQHGVFGRCPESLHKKASELMRLLSANHSFVDGNKRTALNTTWTFYALNGYYFDYGEEIKAILKLYAVMERMVDQKEVTDYFEDIVLSVEDDQAPSDVIELIHLSRWDQDLTMRMQSATSGFSTSRVDEDSESEVDPEKMMELFAEQNKIIERYCDLRVEYEEELPDDTIEYIDSLVDGWETTLEHLQRVSELDTEDMAQEELDEKVEEILEEYEQELNDIA